MFHAWGFGQLVISATLACTVVMRRRFDPEATLEMVRSSGATGLAVVPVMIERIMELPAEVLDRYPLKGQLRFVTASGSRMRSDAVIAFMDRFGDTIYNSYNATEAGLISTAVPADLRVAPDTAGKPVVGTDLRILDDDDREVPHGEVGRITVRSGFQFDGYTSGDTKAFLGDYMVSGDVGRVDEAGRLYVVGRDDEMIVSGGENVYPLEVEETLNAHAAVREAAVLGVDDEKFGQRLAAYVALEPGAEVERRRPAGAREVAAGGLQGAARRDVPRRAAAQRVGQGDEAGAPDSAPGAGRVLPDGTHGGCRRELPLPRDADHAHAHGQGRDPRAPGRVRLRRVRGRGDGPARQAAVVPEAGA